MKILDIQERLCATIDKKKRGLSGGINSSGIHSTLISILTQLRYLYVTNVEVALFDRPQSYRAHPQTRRHRSSGAGGVKPVL